MRLELDAIQADAALHSELTGRPPSIKSQLASGNLWRLVASYTLYGYVSYIFVFWVFPLPETGSPFESGRERLADYGALDTRRPDHVRGWLSLGPTC